MLPVRIDLCHLSTVYLFKYRNRTQLNQVSEVRNLFVTAVISEYISHVANNTHTHLTHLCQGQTESGWTLVKSNGPVSFLKFH